MLRLHATRLAMAGLAALLLVLPPALALALRHRVPSGPASAPAAQPSPSPPASQGLAFVLGRRLGPLAAGLRAEARPSAIAATVTLLDAKGPASGHRVQVALVTTRGSIARAVQPCGPGCYGALLPEQGVPRAIRLTVAGPGIDRTAVFELPDRWPPVGAEQLLLRAIRTFRSLRSVTTDQQLDSGLGAVVRTRYLQVAPDRFSYRIENGPQAVVIGGDRWDRATPSGRWQRATTDPIRTPFLEWAGAPQDVTLIGSRRVAGRAVWLVSFAVARPGAGSPIWFTVAVEKSTGRLIDLRMTAAAHFMHERYSGFDAPARIAPPASG